MSLLLFVKNKYETMLDNRLPVGRQKRPAQVVTFSAQVSINTIMNYLLIMQLYEASVYVHNPKFESCTVHYSIRKSCYHGNDSLSQPSSLHVRYYIHVIHTADKVTLTLHHISSYIYKNNNCTSDSQFWFATIL